MSTNSNTTIGNMPILNNHFLTNIDNESCLNQTSFNSFNENRNNCSSPKLCTNKTKLIKLDKIKECIQQCLSDKSKKKIKNIINNVIDLTDIEKVYLYLNLPTGSPQTLDNVKNKKQGNPFGKKADVEVSQTYVWIQSHLEEDNTVSLPKHEVYEEYRIYCESNLLEPLCVADFGKAMKHIFPNVKPRRLGQRGNSRYCYSGLRKKINFQKPELPDLYSENSEDKQLTNINKTKEDITNFETNENKVNFFSEKNNEKLSFINSNKFKIDNISDKNDKNLILSASSFIILEWARNVFSSKLTTIKDLAKHLIYQNLIDKESIAALTVILSDDLNESKDCSFQKSIEKLFQTPLNKNDNENNILDENKLSLKKKDFILDNNKKDVCLNKKIDKYTSCTSNKKKLDSNEKFSKFSNNKVKKTKKNKNDLILYKQDFKIKKEEANIKLELFDNFNSEKTFNWNDNNQHNIDLKQQKNNDSDPTLFKKEDELNRKNKISGDSFLSSNFADNFNFQIKSSSNQIIDNSSFENNLKRRHSTTGFLSTDEKDLPTNPSISDDTNLKFQIRKHSKGLNISKKRLLHLNKVNKQVLEIKNQDLFDKKIENHLVLKNQKTHLKKYENECNKLVHLKKLLEINLPKQSNFTYPPSSIEMSYESSKLNSFETNGQNINNIKNIYNNQTLISVSNVEPNVLTSTNSLNDANNIFPQINDEDIFSLNNLFNNNNQVDNCEMNLNLNNANSSYITRNSLNYQQNVSLCNLQTQISSTNESDFNKKTFTSTESHFNPIVSIDNNSINGKIDCNNNKPNCISEIEYNLRQNSISCGSSKPLNSFTNSGQDPKLTNTINCVKIQENNLQSNSFSNKLSTPNQQKIFQPSLINKNTYSLPNKNLNRSRHSSGPCYQYSTLDYNKNLPSINDLKNSSLSPLFEYNQITNNQQKNYNFITNNYNFSNSLDKNNLSSTKYQSNKAVMNANNSMFNNPTSSRSEPLSPNYNFISENKLNLNELNLNFRDSPIYTKSNRIRHMSSPYISCTLSQDDSLNQNTTVSNQIIDSINSINGPDSFCNDNVFLQDNSINTSVSNQNLMLNLNNHSLSDEIVENKFIPNTTLMTVNNEKYKYSNSSSPPNILNDDKSFRPLMETKQLIHNVSNNENPSLPKILDLNTIKKSNEPCSTNNQKNWNEISILSNIEETQNNISFSQINTNSINQNYGLENNSILTHRTTENFEEDYLQATLQDLKDCDKDFSKFVSLQFEDDLKDQLRL